MNVSAIGSGILQLVATLLSPSGTYIVSNGTWVAYDGSTLPRTFTVSIAGPLIRNAGLDGPYGLRLFAQGWTSDGGMSGASVTNTTTTPAFTASEFAPMWATISGPITFSTPDADHDGLFDALIVHVPLLVTTPGPVLVYVTMNGPLSLSLPSDTRARFLQTGPYTWDVRFEGRLLRESGVNGPYQIGVIVNFPFVTPGQVIAQIFDTVNTSAYLASQFEGPSATLRLPITSSRAQSSPGGPLDLEVVHVPLHVRAAGNYSVEATPYAPYVGYLHQYFPPYTEAARDLSLSAGDTSVDLVFSATLLNRLPPGEDFTVSIVVARSGAYGDQDSAVWTEKNVTGSALPARPLAVVNVTGTEDGAQCPYSQGAALDPERHFLYMNRSGTASGYGAAVPLQLYPGTFDLWLSGCGRSVVRTLTVSGSEDVTIALPLPPAVPLDRYRITFPSWNRSVADASLTNLDGRATRFWADFAGNLDGTADAKELALYLQTCCVYPFIPAILNLDGSDDEPTSAVLTGVQGAGSILSTVPVAAAVHYEAPLPVPPRNIATHEIILRTYLVGSGFTPYAIEVQLPPGVVGSLNLTASLWPWAGPPAPANVTVQAPTPGSWILTPGGQPPGYNYTWPTVTILTVGSGTTPPPGTGTSGGETVSLVIGVSAGAGLAVLLAAIIVVRWPRKRL